MISSLFFFLAIFDKLDEIAVLKFLYLLPHDFWNRQLEKLAHIAAQSFWFDGEIALHRPIRAGQMLNECAGINLLAAIDRQRGSVRRGVQDASEFQVLVKDLQ